MSGVTVLGHHLRIEDAALVDRVHPGAEVGAVGGEGLEHAFDDVALHPDDALVRLAVPEDDLVAPALLVLDVPHVVHSVTEVLSNPAQVLEQVLLLGARFAPEPGIGIVCGALAVSHACMVGRMLLGPHMLDHRLHAGLVPPGDVLVLLPANITQREQGDGPQIVNRLQALLWVPARGRQIDFYGLVERDERFGFLLELHPGPVDDGLIFGHRSIDRLDLG